MSEGFTIVLGCARSKRTLLAPVVEVLAGRGNPVEVVSGIEGADGPWEDALRRHGARGIYLVCGDPELTLTRIARLREAMARAAIPVAQIWCGPADWDKPSSILRHADSLLTARRSAPPPVGLPSFQSVPGRGASEVSGRAVLPPPTSVPPHPFPPRTIPPMSAPSTMSRPDDSLTDEAVGRSRRLKIGVGVGLGAIALAAVAMFAWPEAKADESATQTAAAQPSEVSPKSSDEGEAAVAGAPQDEPDDDQPQPVVEESVEDEADAEPDTAAQPPLEIETQPATPTDAGEEAQRIFAALADQKMRALDILLIAPEATVEQGRRTRPAKLRYEEAEAFCENMVVEGITDWRLPDVGELGSLTESNMLARSVYWSSTKGDSFGNKRVVWNAPRRKMVSVPTRWKGARTVCVRTYDPKAK